jgi:hypothetical protein
LFSQRSLYYLASVVSLTATFGNATEHSATIIPDHNKLFDQQDREFFKNGNDFSSASKDILLSN